MERQVKNLLKQQRRRFRKKFGRDPGPADPVFFDPDADEPRPLDFSKPRRDEAFEKAGQARMMGSAVYAMLKTGHGSAEGLTGAQLEEWYRAIGEYVYEEYLADIYASISDDS